MSKSITLGLNDSGIVNLNGNSVGVKMLDRLSRLDDTRRIQPLDQFDNITYEHRYYYDEYNLLIGDTYFMIPPEFIMVSSESPSQNIVTLRQENTQKIKSGYHKRTILIDIVFNGIEQLNGYPVEGPEGTYYMDGLRQLLAQFKCTPFLPVSSKILNSMYGIYTVALQSIVIRTMDGFPDAMTAQITLQEVNMFPYIQMPDAAFKYMIDWDLFRFYYQGFTTEKHTYKKLQSLPKNKEYNKFKLSILDESVFSSGKANNYNMLQILTDEKIVKESNDDTNKTNYTEWINSETDNINITSFQCGYSNILTNIQLSDAGSPTVQFMGGMDTIYNITFETTDYSVVQALEQCQISNDVLIRSNRKYNSVGFVKLESELVEFTGSLFVVIDSVTTNTVPGFPDLYNIQMQCVAYDISQSNREDLNGFKPFPCNSGKCGYYDSDTNEYVSDHVHSDQAIDQNFNGLTVKVKQDNYAEWKLRSSIELYPDLKLPTYKDVDKVIDKIKKFRNKHNLGQLEYDKYPTAPINTLQGLDINNTLSVKYDNESKTIVDYSSVDDSKNRYNGFVDPDFYVFYPHSFNSFLIEDEECYNGYTPMSRNSVTKTKVKQNYDYYNDESSTSDSTPDLSDNESLVDTFITRAKSFKGCRYVLGAAGEIDTQNMSRKGLNLKFDCSGFITYLLKSMGIMAQKDNRLTVSSIRSNKILFTKIDWSLKQKGDLLVRYDENSAEKNAHVVIYLGNNEIIHASNSKPYPQGGVKISEVYFKDECYRINAFNKYGQTKNVIANLSENQYEIQVWNALKKYGLSDYACAGIMGNMKAESGVNPTRKQIGRYNIIYTTDASYTAAVDNGSYSKDKFVNDSIGYGLVQFTYSVYKKQLYEEAKKRGVSVSNVQLQVDILMKQIKANGVFNKLVNASSIKQASNIFLLEYERPKDQSSKVQTLRANNAKLYYNKFQGIDNSSVLEVTKVNSILTKDEFESICRVIMAATKGETSKAEKAVAQAIYDMLTDSDSIYKGLGDILNSSTQLFGIHSGALNSTIEKNVKDVFCENKKYWDNYVIKEFLSVNKITLATIKKLDKKYDRLKDVDKHMFWGKKKSGSNIKYVIEDKIGTGDASMGSLSYVQNVTHEAITINSIEQFGKPVIIRTKGLMYDNNWTPWGNFEGKIAKKELNSTENIFSTSFCDEVQYSARGKLVRAFPTYLFAILDDNAQWFDGRKLWTNYYVYKSVTSIAVHGTNDMPTETAEITISNVYNNLSKVQGGLSSYDIEDDTGYAKFIRKWYKLTGCLLGFGPKLTDKLIKLHQVIYDHAMLREGARIHLKMGYGSDPLGLATMINGHISSVSLGDQISIIVTSDGHELIQNIVSGNPKENNTGWLGAFGVGESQESSNIISEIICSRQSWATYLMKDTFEGSKYAIEHFGLYFNRDIMYFMGNFAKEGFKKVKDDVTFLAEDLGVKGATIGRETVGRDLPILSNVTEFLGCTIGTILGGIGGFISGSASAISTEGSKAVITWSNDVNDAITNIWDGYQEQYDLLKNIYKANYKREHYIYTTAALGKDYEKNIVFSSYNMTPWDVFQICTQQVPEYIIKPSYHQFDSRIYFGLPFWMEKYRYDYINGEIYEECKTAAQVHFIDSMDCIIDNQVKVTSKHSFTNAKIIYTRGSSAATTTTIHSDDTIDFSKQKTKIIDTSICQDALGPDAVYEFFSAYKIGKESARRVGISNLLYGWQQQYQGELILMGHPGVKPHDYLMINDTFANLYGLAIAREVVHSFNTNTGFITSIVPGMVGFSTDENSGMIETTQNYLMLLNCFSSYTMIRKNLRNNYEKNLALISDIESTRLELESKTANKAIHNVGSNITQLIVSGVTAAKIGKASVNVVKSMYNLHKTGKVVQDIATTYKAVKGTANGIKATLAAAKAGSITVGTAAGGIPGLIAAAVWVAVDVLLANVIEWYSNRNVCVLLPLWWEGYLFVSGVKDGEKITLVQNNANPTEENTAEDSISRE